MSVLKYNLAENEINEWIVKKKSEKRPIKTLVSTTIRIVQVEFGVYARQLQYK